MKMRRQIDLDYDTMDYDTVILHNNGAFLIIGSCWNLKQAQYMQYFYAITANLLINCQDEPVSQTQLFIPSASPC
mgnify:FL=1